MDEEQAVLDFFARPENLPLGLSVAEQIDQVRIQMNNHFWRELRQRIDAQIAKHGLPWQTAPTEDKNAEDCIVGLHCIPRNKQAPSLHPMIEQQFIGGAWRIYYGLMWSAAPASDQLSLHSVTKLKTTLQNAGFKSNENFLGWQWTILYPRRKDFLLRYSCQPEKLLDDTEAAFNVLLLEHIDAIAHANESLYGTAARHLTSALGPLRDELID